VRAQACSGSLAWSATQTEATASSAGGVASAASPIAISVAPNQASGDRTRPDRRPAAIVPSARPPMKLASTVLAA